MFANQMSLENTDGRDRHACGIRAWSSYIFITSLCRGKGHLTFSHRDAVSSRYTLHLRTSIAFVFPLRKLRLLKKQRKRIYV